MNILLTNDDGYKSKIFNLLRERLKYLGHNVYCFTPHKNCSGISYAFSVNNTLSLTKLESDYTIVEGTPIECIHIGVEYLKNNNINLDLVISGPNNGLNYGSTINYSGTVSAALEAQLYNLKSMSISINNNIREDEYVSTVNIIGDIIEDNYIIMNYYTTINLNFFCGNPSKIINENTDVNFKFRLLNAKFDIANHCKVSLHYSNSTDDIFSNSLMVGSISRKHGYINNSFLKRMKWGISQLNLNNTV